MPNIKKSTIKMAQCTKAPGLKALEKAGELFTVKQETSTLECTITINEMGGDNTNSRMEMSQEDNGKMI